MHQLQEGTLYGRHVKPEVDAALDDTPVAVIVGPRQCGKSTLAGQIAAERGARQVTLDDAGPRAAASSDPTGFIDQAELPFVIDEFQKAPALLPAIKSRVDRERGGGHGASGMFLLTGSANVWATLRISESLAGRAERVQLWPLSQGEVLGSREGFIDGVLSGKVPQLTDAPTGRAAVSIPVVVGGYPEMLRRTDPGRRSRWVASYIRMILERDVRDLVTKAQQLEELPRLLALAAARVGNLLEISAIGRDLGMQRDTAKRYLTLLELLFLLRRAPAWSRNIGQRLIKAPKIWLPDSGLACQLTGYGERRFEDDDTGFAGALFENFVASEIAKQASWCRAEVRLYHFRTAGGREVDLLIEADDGAVVGVETKLGTTVGAGDFAALRHLQQKLGKRLRAGVVIHTGRETLPFGDRLWAVPVAGLWTSE